MNQINNQFVIQVR